MRRIFFASCLLAAASSHAQELDALYTMSLEQLLKVTVTGSTLTEETTKSVPAALTLYSHEEIDRLGLDTLDELMNLVPGYQSSRNGGSSLFYPYSSRLRRISGDASEILILVDGQRIDDPRSSGSAVVVPKIPLSQIERVEFIRGPGSAVYGSNAMMGVVNIVTRSGVNELSLAYGSFERNQARLQLSQKTGDVSIDLFGLIDADDGDDYRVQDTFSSNFIDTQDPRETLNLNLKLQWRNTRLNLQYYQLELDDFYETSRLSNAGFNERSSRFSAISLRQDFSSTSTTSYLWLGHHRTKSEVVVQASPLGTFIDLSIPPSAAPLLGSGEDKTSEESRVQWHTDWNIDRQSDLQFGVEYRHIYVPELYSKGNYDLVGLLEGKFPVDYYGSLERGNVTLAEASRDIVGLYVQYQLELFAATNITVGLRHDDFSSIASQFSPRLALVQGLGDHHNLKLLYAEAFRAPTENELGFVNNGVFLGDSDLESETVKSWDLIWLWQYKRFSYSLGYYETHFDNAIVKDINDEGIEQFQNTEQDPSKGFEFELTYETNSHWLMRSSYTHSIEKPNLSFREAREFASISVNYQRRRWNANLLATWQDNGESLDSKGKGNKLDPYTLLNGKLQYNVTPQWQLFLQAKNILDKDYETPADGNGVVEGIPNRGSEFLTGIVWKI